jgi:hypothetical protein
MGDDIWPLPRLANRTGLRLATIERYSAELETHGVRLQDMPLDRAVIAVIAYQGGHTAPGISVLAAATYLPSTSWLVSVSAPGTYAAVFPSLLHATTFIADHPNGTYHLSPVGAMGLEVTA